MTERLVVSFCHRKVSARAPEQSSHLQVARALAKRASARGGSLVSWGARMLSFEFDCDALEDAVELCAEECAQQDAGFSVGMAQGEQEPVNELAPGFSLGWGPGLVRAEALARIAGVGELLADPGLDAVRSGELLSLGSRIRMLGQERLRGQRVDLKYPFRSELARGIGELLTPLLIGRPELAELRADKGQVAILYAARGLGGSRFLGELARSLEPGRVLRLMPSQVGEPFGALRRGLLKARARGQAPAVLEGVHAESLESLLAGEGLDLEACAGLLCTWLRPSSSQRPSGAVILDDVAGVDHDTLEVVCAAMAERPFRLFVRCLPGELLPAPLADLPQGNSVSITPLGARESAELARAWVGGELEAAAAERFARLGRGEPLAIAEAIAEAIEAGELVWEGGRASPRRLRTARGASQPASHWIERRARHLEPGPRAVLFALAVLGGEADASDVTALVTQASDVEVDVERVVRVLERMRWLRRSSPELWCLPSVTHGEVILSLLSGERLAAWHRDAAVVLANSDRPLGAASAAAHAMLGGDFESAALLSRRAAASARAVDLQATGAALDAFSAERDPALLSGRGLAPSVLPVDLFAESYRIPEHALPGDSLLPPSPLRPGRLELAPPRLPGPDVLAFAAAGALGRGEEPLPVSGLDESREAPVAARGESGAQPPSAPVGPLSEAPEELGELDVEFVDEPGTNVTARNEMARRATELLRVGDFAGVAELARSLRSRGRHLALADRLDALAKLGQGDALTALSALRRARDLATASDAIGEGARGDRCRASLAHAIGLSAAGRGAEALLEALAGLAYARDASDRRGELACARFIAQLSDAASHRASGRVWAAVASRLS